LKIKSGKIKNSEKILFPFSFNIFVGDIFNICAFCKRKKY